MRTIIIKLSGGIGNQIFQYLFGVSQFKRRDTELLFDVTDCLLSNGRGFSLHNLGITGNFFQCERNIIDFGGQTYIELSNLNWISQVLETLDSTITAKLIRENSITYDPSIIEYGHNAYYDGYWQSFHYWNKDLATIDELETQLTNSTLSLEARENLNALQITPDICAIHVRRGDYLALQQRG